MVVLRERNGQKHIVSTSNDVAFAWGAYYANYSTIILNGTSYMVKVLFGVSITLSNQKELPYGDWVVFESENGLKIFDKETLDNLRNEHPLQGHYVCFNEETFMAA